jgi:SEC-C motif domain protein
MMKSKAGTLDCPCRARDEQPVAYAQCCQPWHVGWSQGVYADTPEQLMRSRYSAYALAVRNNPQGHAMLAYLHATWHVSTVPDGLELSPIQWMGLQVLHAQASQDAGVVEFVAHYKESGKAHKMHEVSRFVRSDDAAHWLYVDGLVQED